jgi:hypothetical protein
VGDLQNLEEYITAELNVQKLTLSADEAAYNVKVRWQLDAWRWSG